MTQQNNCKWMSICNRTDLITEEGEYITKEILKEKCNQECVKKSTCYMILDLLKANRRQDAESVLSGKTTNA